MNRLNSSDRSVVPVVEEQNKLRRLDHFANWFTAVAVAYYSLMLMYIHISMNNLELKILQYFAQNSTQNEKDIRAIMFSRWLNWIEYHR